MTTDLENRRKLMISVGALVLAVIVTVGTWLWSARRDGQSDRASLTAQRQASGMPDPAQMREQMLEGMAKELNLTGAQKSQVAKLQEEMMATMERNRPQGNPDWEKMRGQMEKMRREQDAGMAKILTPEQAAKYKALQERGPGMGGPGGMGGPPMMGGGPGGMMPGRMPGGMPPNGPPPGGMFPGSPPAGMSPPGSNPR